MTHQGFPTLYPGPHTAHTMISVPPVPSAERGGIIKGALGATALFGLVRLAPGPRGHTCHLQISRPWQVATLGWLGPGTAQQYNSIASEPSVKFASGAPLLEAKIAQLVRLGSADGTDLFAAGNAETWASMFAAQGTYNGYPLPSATGTAALTAELQGILSAWDTLEDPVGGPRWSIKPLNTPDGTPLTETTTKVILEMTATGTVGGVSYAVPMTSVLYLNAEGKVESLWDFFDVTDFPAPARS